MRMSHSHKVVSLFGFFINSTFVFSGFFLIKTSLFLA